MKGENLFRGKTESGRWIFGSLILSKKSNPIIIEINDRVIRKDGDDWYINAPACEVIPETAGQFIGLTDKVGITIFEDDLVEKNGVVYRIMWNNLHAMWGLFTKSGQSEEEILCDTLDEKGNIAKFWKDSTLLIIDNIHDNPELFK